MKSSTPSVIIDTNVFVSMALGGRVSSEILRQFTQNRFRLLYSPYLLQELEYVLSRKQYI